MNRMIIASIVALFATSAFAEATMESKGTSSNGSPIGKQSSQVSGNGDWVSGNGTQDGTYGAGDQTTDPGSRADAVAGQNTGKPGQIGK